jgi:hypothetical protein
MQVTTNSSVTRLMNKPSVTFETDRRYNNQNAYPFFYAFVPYPYLNTNHLNGGQGLMGIRVPAGQNIPIPIRLDRDSVYRQLSVKYTVYREFLNQPLNLVITTTAGSRQVTVDNSAILEVGDALAWLDSNGNIKTGVISRIISATSVALEEPCTSAAAAAALFTRGYKWYDSPVLSPVSVSTPMSGTIAMAPNQNPIVGDGFTVIGTLTLFLSEIRVDDILVFMDSDGYIQYVAVKHIISDTELILVKKFPEDVEAFAGTTIARADYRERPAGEIAVPLTSTALTGFSTTFTTDLEPGAVVRSLYAPAFTKVMQIASVTNDTNAVLLYPAAVTVGVPMFFGDDFQKIAQGATGLISITANNKLVTGVGTAFLTEVKEGSVIYIQTGSSTFINFTVDRVISDTELLVTTFIDNPPGVPVVFGVGILALDFNDAVAGENLIFRPLTDLVRVSFHMPSQQGRYLYGGGQVFMGADNDDMGFRMRPHLVSSLQGVDDGLGQLRTPTVQPYEGVVVATIYNDSDSDVIVNGCLFGYKITFTSEALHE